MKINMPSTEKRRSAIGRITGLFLGIFSASAAVRAGTEAKSSYKKTSIVGQGPINPRVLIQTTRDDFGLQGVARTNGDLLDGSEIIGDSLTLISSGDELENEGVKIQDRLRKLVIGLMHTEQYDHQNKVSMKFILRSVEEELSFVLGSLQDETMSAEAARSKLRISINNFLTQLEQLPNI